MKFHLGTFLGPHSKVSMTSFTLGSGGKMNSFWAMNSLRMSFWMVPPSFFQSYPFFLATARYMAQMALAGLLMVMEVVTSSRLIPSKRISMSARLETATPHLPTSPLERG